MIDWVIVEINFFSGDNPQIDFWIFNFSANLQFDLLISKVWYKKI